MLTGTSLSVTGANIALFTKTNENNLAESLIRLASGKRVNCPSDNIPDYFNSQRLQQNSRASERVLRGIGEGIAFMDVASLVGENVFTSISDMRELVKSYYADDVTDDEKSAFAADFAALKNTVTTVIAASTYDGARLVSDNGGTPFKKIALDTEQALTFDISYTSAEVADVSSLTIGTSGRDTELSALEAELGKSGSYLAKTSAYTRGLNAQYAVTNRKQEITSQAADRVTDADIGEEYVQSMNRSIRNQSSFAMLAQAHMFQSSITRLFG